ncbi:MAG: ABC transporter permease [Candidatus Thorarchaeota archaeon]
MARKAKNMVFYLIKRVLFIIPMLLLVLIVTWLISQTLVEEAVLRNMSGLVDPLVVQEERIRLGLDKPVLLRLAIYLTNFFRGNWGESYTIQRGKPVLEIVAIILPRTIELVIIPTVIIPIIAVKLGIISAKNKDKTQDNIVRGVAILGRGLPVFWFAIVLQIFIGFTFMSFTQGEFYIPILKENSFDYPMGYYPAPDGAFRTNFRIIDSFLYNDQEFLFDTLLHLVLPMLCMTIVSLAAVTRQTRSSMLEVLEQDYIRTARAKGVQEDLVLNKHALRNAMIPTSNFIIGGVARRLTGSLLVETSFNYTGFGYWMVFSIRNGDLAVINGLLVFSSIIILSGILIADVMYTIIDPRITYK